MEEKIKELKNNYIAIRNQSQSAIKYIRNEEDIIKLKAGIVTFNMVIDDLETVLKDYGL